ncbi:long-chain fatty acid--CoA ligase [Pollutimonas harenae]|nr:long-chain fatty acid--CoA ligase [Pollutimonas harenae]
MKFIHEIPQQQAERQPDAICLYPEAAEPIRYGQLWQHIVDAADWMRSLGVSSGHKVMIVGENCPEMIVMLFACSTLGAWPISVNARLSSREIETIARHSDPTLTFFTARCSDAASAHAETYAAQACESRAFPAGNRAALQNPTTPPEAAELAQAVATLVYTSGTTGAPKGVMVTHKGLLHFAAVSAMSRRMQAHDIAYAALPVSHIFGIATVLMATFQAGASLVLRAKFDVSDVLGSLADPGISILQGVPTMFVRVLSATTGQGPITAPALRYVYTGGAAMDMALKAKVEALFNLPLHHGYGITEYAGSMFITDIDHPRRDSATGHAVEGVELQIVLDGVPVTQPGDKGDILIRGPGTMLGYYRNPEQTAKALLPGGWLHTGDIGYVDADGALFITGRSKDLIIRSGFNVYPQEVEAVINAFPGIRLSAVVGKPQDDGNEEVIAFYEPDAGQSIDLPALAQYLVDHLAPYKRPARMIAIKQIPTTMSGKIQKNPLRAQLLKAP